MNVVSFKNFVCYTIALIILLIKESFKIHYTIVMSLLTLLSHFVLSTAGKKKTEDS